MMRLRHAVVTMGMGLLAVAVTGGVRSAQDYTAMMTATPATTPIPSCLPKGTVPDLTNVAALAAGTAHVLALHTDGTAGPEARRSSASLGSPLETA